MSDEDTESDQSAAVLPSVLGLVVVLLVVLALAQFRDRESSAPDLPRPADIGAVVDLGEAGAAGEAVVVAREAAKAFFTLDHRHVDADVARMAALTTGEFRREYAAQAQSLKQRVVRQKLVVTAALPRDGTATEYLSSTAAQLLVSVDVTTKARGRHAKGGRYRTRVELGRRDGEWLVSALEQVG